MDVAVSIFPRVINRLVAVTLGHILECPRIDSRFIGQNDFYIFANMVSKNLTDGSSLSVLSADQPQISIALTDADYDLFVRAWPPTPRFSAYIRLIHFHGAIQRFGRYFQHGRADSMAQIPCRLVTDSQRALNLAGR